MKAPSRATLSPKGARATFRGLSLSAYNPPTYQPICPSADLPTCLLARPLFDDGCQRFDEQRAVVQRLGAVYGHTSCLSIFAEKHINIVKNLNVIANEAHRRQQDVAPALGGVPVDEGFDGGADPRLAGHSLALKSHIVLRKAQGPSHQRGSFLHLLLIEIAVLDSFPGTLCAVKITGTGPAASASTRASAVATRSRNASTSPG